METTRRKENRGKSGYLQKFVTLVGKSDFKQNIGLGTDNRTICHHFFVAVRYELHTAFAGTLHTKLADTFSYYIYQGKHHRKNKV